MSLTLTGAELRRLGACMRTLLSPLDFTEPRQWRLAVTRELRSLVEAETAVFAERVDGVVSADSNELDPAQLARFVGFNFQDGGASRAAALPLEVGTQTQVVAGDWAGYHGDPMVNEFYKPYGLLDTIFYLVQWPEDGTISVIEMHGSRQGARSCGEGAAARLELLLPALKAGLRSSRRLAAQRDVLGRMMDVLREGLAIYDRRGRLVHENTEFRRLLGAAPQEEQVRQEVDHLAARMARAPNDTASPALRPFHEFDSGTVRYRCRGTVVGSDLLLPDTAILIGLERLTPEPPSPGALMERFGLSKKEAAVAILLSEGQSNEDVARSLRISPHTARHHTEKILMKLGVRSRTEAAVRVLQM